MQSGETSSTTLKSLSTSSDGAGCLTWNLYSAMKGFNHILGLQSRIFYR
jgi:hypothetical protein